MYAAMSCGNPPGPQDHRQFVRGFPCSASGVKNAYFSTPVETSPLNPVVKKQGLPGISMETSPVLSREHEGEDEPYAIIVILGQPFQKTARVDSRPCPVKALQEVEPGEGRERKGAFLSQDAVKRKGKETPERGRYLRHRQVKLGDGPHVNGNSQSVVPQAEWVKG